MITRVEIDGFKSFPDFKLDVPPFLALVGPNASGKSNLFDAIEFNQEALRSPETALLKARPGRPVPGHCAAGRAVSRPLVPGLPAENTTDELFLGAVVFRQLRALAEKGTRQNPLVPVRETEACLLRLGSGRRSRADYFDYVGQNVDLDVLAQIPAYADWVAETEEALKGLGYL